MSLGSRLATPDPSLTRETDKIAQRQPVVVYARDQEQVLTMVIKWPMTAL